MAKKKKKTFPKSQLLSIFESGNYQKVISKIKQFKIEGMSEKELYEIMMSSYEQLANNNFDVGDMARALRDIESLLNIDDSEFYRLIKFKYLCYIEHFKDAVEFGEDLIISKDSRIKKEAIFFYLLANIYSGNYEIDQKYLKLLPVARQNYILGFIEFLRGNKDKALEFLHKCNPRAQIEKENLQAVKSIILNQETVHSDTLKPLYRFLICGESENLQNTKNSRVIKKEVLSKFSKKTKGNDMKNLLSLKNFIPMETIFDNAQDKEQQNKLIYNNIVLLIEKQENHTKAIELFIKYRQNLVLLVESGMLFIELNNHAEDKRSDKILIHFFTNYLKLHHKKLSDFQLNYIFMSLIQKDKYMIDSFNLAKEYGGDDVVFLLKDLPTMRKLQPHYQDSFNAVVKRYSCSKNIMLINLSNHLESIDEEFKTFSKEEKTTLIIRLDLFLTLLKNLQRPHKKYQKALFDILGNLAFVCQSFDIKKHKELYVELAKTIDVFIDYYKVSKIELSVDIKALFVSMQRDENLKTTTFNRHRESIFDMTRRLFLNEDCRSDRYNFDESEYELSLIKKDFIDALKNNKDPFANALIQFNPYRTRDVIFKFILDLVAKAVECKRYDSIFIDRLLLFLEIPLRAESFRDLMLSEVRSYAKKDVKTALLFLNNSIISIATQDREYVWYLKWLEGYVMLVNDYNLPQDRAFNGCLQHFIRTQEKKKYKSLNAKYKKIMKNFKDKGRLF